MKNSSDIFLLDKSMRMPEDSLGEISTQMSYVKAAIFSGIVLMSPVIAWKGDLAFDFYYRNIVRTKVTSTLYIPDLESKEAVLTLGHVALGGATQAKYGLKDIHIELDHEDDPKLILFEKMCLRDDIDPETTRFCWDTLLAYNDIFPY